MIEIPGANANNPWGYLFSVRVRNILMHERICSMEDLLKKTRSELALFSGMGITSLNEIDEVLRKMGMKLGMDCSEFPLIPIEVGLRDYLAARAMQALITSGSYLQVENDIPMNFSYAAASKVAIQAYKYADEMLREKTKEKDQPPCSS